MRRLAEEEFRGAGAARLPAGVLADIARFHCDWATVKVDWALDAPIPWAAEPARRAGVVHVADDLDELTTTGAQIAMGLLPARPFLVMGQYAVVDPTRSPPGTDTAWAYTHVPRTVRGDAGGELAGDWARGDAERLADRIEARIEALAPGFRAPVR